MKINYLKLKKKFFFIININKKKRIKNKKKACEYVSMFVLFCFVFKKNNHDNIFPHEIQ